MKVLVSLLALLLLTNCAQRSHEHEPSMPEEWEEWRVKVEERIDSLESDSSASLEPRVAEVEEWLYDLSASLAAAWESIAEKNQSINRLEERVEEGSGPEPDPLSSLAELIRCRDPWAEGCD